MSERPNPAAPLTLPPRLQAILDAEYPRFSDAEMGRRRSAIEDVLKEADLDHLVFCGANRFGSAVQWLTGWPVTTEAVGVLTPGEPDAMFVQHVNHAPMARRIAAQAEVAWGSAPPSRSWKSAARATARSASSGR
jgi:Xaa-Pro dipeptidase